jgi:hypothetical protein
MEIRACWPRALNETLRIPGIMWKIAIALALLIVAALAGWFFIGTRAPFEDVGGPLGPMQEQNVPPIPLPPESATGTDSQAGPAAAEPLPDDPEWVLPALDQSDAFVREELTAMGLPEQWSSQDELVRRLAAVIENAARGEYPRRQFALLALQPPFQVVERDGRMYVDPANYTRYEPLVTALERVDPRRVARLVGFLMPLIDTSIGELGESGSGRSFMAAGLQKVLEVPVVAGDVEVLRPNVFYTYADPSLEQLGALQKLLLRAGPANVQRVQAYARQVAGVMGIPVGASEF